jgi:Na+/H+ antiporter subunit
MTEWIADVLIVLGLIVMTLGVYGIVRFPDAYTQLHASSKAAFPGVSILLVATAQQLPLRLAGLEAAALEASGAADVLDLAEDRLDGVVCAWRSAPCYRRFGAWRSSPPGARRSWTPTACRPCGACPGGRAWQVGSAPVRRGVRSGWRSSSSRSRPAACQADPGRRRRSASPRSRRASGRAAAGRW